MSDPRPETINDFHIGATKIFTVDITHDGDTPDIRNDTVEVTFEEKATALTYTFSGDVTTYGENGIAYFHLYPVDTAEIANTGDYWYEVLWKYDDKEVIVAEGGCRIKRRRSPSE